MFPFSRLLVKGFEMLKGVLVALMRGVNRRLRIQSFEGAGCRILRATD